MYLFSYGSNSTEQLKKRICIKRDLLLKSGYIKNYIRIFSGKSQKWNGGIATIYPCLGEKVYGIIVDLSKEELNILNFFEKGYHLEKINVIINNNEKECYVYIKNNNLFIDMPSEEYMLAINKMLNERKYKSNRKISIKGLVDNKIVTLGYWKNTN